MNRQTDQELLRDYVQRASEAAFSELVRRYVDLVYSAAFRMVRDQHLAEDVSQGVFVALARNAGSLANGAVLSNWLHRTAHHISANAVRTEVRRRAREKAATTMNEMMSSESCPSWESIAPQFDEVLRELSDPDRDALLLRYFQRQSAREMGASLGISSEAAQKRVNRAIERLRDLFAKRGIAVGTGGLTVFITTRAVEAAPPGLAVGISSIALRAASFHTTTAITVTKLIAMTTLQKTLIAATVFAAIWAGWHKIQQPAPVRPLARAAEAMPPLNRPKEEPKPDLAPTPTVKPARPRAAHATLQAALPKSSAARPFTSTQMYQLLKSKTPTLTRAQIEPYLNAKGRNAASLLAGYRTTIDPSLLAEAVQKFPTDPQVAFEAANQNGISVEERQHWLDVLNQAAPDNSLASYLSADAHLKASQADDAIRDLTAAAASQKFDLYSAERISANEEAYLSAGYSPGEAKLLANNFLTSPYLVQLKELGPELVALAATYQNGGDQSSHDAALQTAINLGRRLTEPSASEPLLSQLIGIGIERTALAAMDPSAVSSADGQTVQQRLDQLGQQKEAIHVLTGQADPLWRTLSDQDWMDYYAQMSVSGEEQALQWLVSNYGPR